jgi:hypothetical protein
MAAEKLITRRWTCTECNLDPPNNPCTMETKSLGDDDPIGCNWGNDTAVWVEVPLCDLCAYWGRTTTYDYCPDCGRKIERNRP